jgi:hypothetical protein
MKRSFTQLIVLSLTLCALLLLGGWTLGERMPLPLNAAETTRAFTLKAGQNQAATPADGLGTEKDVYPNSTITGADEGAFVNTKISRFSGTFAYGTKEDGTWATYSGSSGYFLMLLEIHNPTTVSGHYCLSGGVSYAPTVAFYTGTIASHSDLGYYEMGENTSTALQAYTIDVASKSLKSTPTMVGLMVNLANGNKDNIIITVDDFTVNYAC